MADPLQTLETDLNTLATADTGDPQNGTATAQAALTAAQQVLSLLADQSLVGATIGAAVSGVYTAIAGAISDDVVSALQGIAKQLKDPSMAGINVGDVSSALSSLQNVLQTAQNLMPGGGAAAASALASTSQFAALFASLLSDAGSVGAAGDKLYEIAQQLQAIATAFTAAAQGNP